MKRNGIFPVWFVTFYLLLYCILIQFRYTAPFAIVMLFVSPALVVWMVWSVLKRGKYEGRMLNNDEFGYHEKPGEQLKLF